MPARKKHSAETEDAKTMENEGIVSHVKGDPDLPPSEASAESQETVTNNAESSSDHQAGPAEAPPTEKLKEEELSEEEKLRIRTAELEDRFLRTAAEFENYKKRTARQFEEIIRGANDKILVELLGVVDNFERALRHSKENAETTDIEALRRGMELIFNQVAELLSKYDITPIETVGRPFDPNLHEALLSIGSDEYPAGVVAVEMSKGYRQGDRVLRHSKVGVSKGKNEKEEKGDEI
jgi:molecular chaperone GrpE